MPHIQDIHVCIVHETVACLHQSTNLMVSYLLLLPWCTAITSCWISNNNSNSQQQTTTGYGQISKSLPGMSWPTGVKTTTNGIYMWQFKYANIMSTVLCISNGLIYGYLSYIPLAFPSACRQKKYHVACHMKFATIHWNFASIISYTSYSLINWWLYMSQIIHNLH